MRHVDDFFRLVIILKKDETTIDLIDNCLRVKTVEDDSWYALWFFDVFAPAIGGQGYN